MASIPKCERPTKPGLYLCLRAHQPKPEVAEIREEKEGLLYLSGISIFPLTHLEKSALFWGPIEVEPHPPV